ncbi:MAG: hypothetical protein Q4F43_05210 [Eubacteriales bacterium]|nr:hypothetical protein [Eubacteriales bacterium]
MTRARREQHRKSRRRRKRAALQTRFDPGTAGAASEEMAAPVTGETAERREIGN